MNKINKNPFEEIKKIRMTDSERLSMRQSLVNHMKANPLKNSQTSTVSNGQTFFEVIFKSQRVLASLVVLAGLVGLLSVSENAKPGDPLYPIRVYLSDPINSLFGRDNSGDSGGNDSDLEMMQMQINSTGASDETNLYDANIVEEDDYRLSAPASSEEQRLENVSSDPDDVNSVNPSPDQSTTPAQKSSPSSISSFAPASIQTLGTIVVRLPDSETQKKAGENLYISWSGGVDDQSKVKIEITGRSLSGTTEYPTIEIDQSTGVDDYGSFINWTIPANLETGKYKVKVWQVTHEDLAGYSQEFLVTGI